MSAANRRRGHDAERAVARWLREHGYPNAQTSRAALGHDGTRQPGDVIHGPQNLVVSVKDVAASAWPTWERQAAAEAGGRPWVVVRRVRGTSDVALWLCRWGDAGPGVLEHGTGTFGGFLALFDDAYIEEVA